VLQCVAVCCSVLQCVAVCCSVLQCVAVCSSDSGVVPSVCARGEVFAGCNVCRCVSVCCSMARCVAVCCSVLQRSAVSSEMVLVKKYLRVRFSKVSSFFNSI